MVKKEQNTKVILKKNKDLNNCPFTRMEKQLGKGQTHAVGTQNPTGFIITS